MNAMRLDAFPVPLFSARPWCLSHRDQGRCKRLRTLRRAIRSNQRRFADAIGALRRLGGG
jgi:hypothetical protein